jgi:hypothetical protein
MSILELSLRIHPVSLDVSTIIVADPNIVHARRLFLLDSIVVGHTRETGKECYFTALINHSLSGERRSVRRRRELKNLYLQTEKFADDFAIQELLKLREERTN